LENNYEPNGCTYKLSITKFRKLTNDYTISDDLAEEKIESLYQLSLIAYEINE